MVLAGTIAYENGFKTFGLLLDVWYLGQKSIFTGLKQNGLSVKWTTYDLEEPSTMEKPLASIHMGLIYVKQKE
jgi:catalase-peroxidase